MVLAQGAGLSGTGVWRPPRTGSLSAARFRTRHTRGIIGILSFTGEPPASALTRAHVERTDAAGAVHTCADVAASPYASLSFQTLRTRARLSLGESGLNLVTTRCAGPLARDITPALPVPQLSFAELRRGSGRSASRPSERSPPAACRAS